MEQWMGHRDEYLDELLRRDGLSAGSPQHGCHACEKTDVANVMRCRDCAGGRHFCADCILSAHGALPLHRVEVSTSPSSSSTVLIASQRWNGAFFDTTTTLCDLGLRVQLGHNGSCCPRSLKNKVPFTVVAMNGIHSVSVDYCACDVAVGGEYRQQAMRFGWWPATLDLPQSMVTFEALNVFERLTLTSKISMYDFYRSLAQLTDGITTGSVKVSVPWPSLRSYLLILHYQNRYREFIRCVKQCRNVTSMKRGARGHDVSGIRGTPAGACAVECPACPHPGRNLPVGWEAAPKDIK